MTSLIRKKLVAALLTASALMVLQSCVKNDEFEEVPTPPLPAVPGTNVAQALAADPSLSILKAAVERAGIGGAFGADARFTVFAPDNDAFAASGLSLQAVNAMPLAQLQAILSYHVIPQAIPTTAIPADRPNVQMPTLLQLPGGNPLVKNSIFPARTVRGVYANNIPVKQADIAVGNSVVHKVAALVAPPSQLIAQILGADTSLSMLRAVIARADSGQVGLNRIDSVTRFGVANITLFAPTNQAFRGLFPPGTPDAMVLGALNSPQAFPLQTLRAILVYHILGSRVFSVSLPTTPAFMRTLLNNAVATHPGVRVAATFTGPFATSATVTGVGNIAAGASPANIITTDLNAVNGVVHKIDRVLLPQ